MANGGYPSGDAGVTTAHDFLAYSLLEIGYDGYLTMITIVQKFSFNY